MGMNQIKKAKVLLKFLPPGTPEAKQQGCKCRVTKALIDPSNCPLHMGFYITEERHDDGVTFVSVDLTKLLRRTDNG